MSLQQHTFHCPGCLDQNIPRQRLQQQREAITESGLHWGESVTVVSAAPAGEMSWELTSGLTGNTAPDDDLVTTAVCSSPQAMMVISSFLIQNLLGAFSANLDFPNVNTAPVSGISGSSISTLIGQ